MGRKQFPKAFDLCVPEEGIDILIRTYCWMGFLSHTIGQKQSRHLNVGVQLLMVIYFIFFPFFFLPLGFFPQELFSINNVGTYQFSSFTLPTIISPLNHCLTPTKISFQQFSPRTLCRFVSVLFQYVGIMRLYTYNEFTYSCSKALRHLGAQECTQWEL